MAEKIGSIWSECPKRYTSEYCYGTLLWGNSFQFFPTRFSLLIAHWTACNRFLEWTVRFTKLKKSAKYSIVRRTRGGGYFWPIHNRTMIGNPCCGQHVESAQLPNMSKNRGFQVYFSSANMFWCSWLMSSGFCGSDTENIIYFYSICCNKAFSVYGHTQSRGNCLQVQDGAVHEEHREILEVHSRRRQATSGLTVRSVFIVTSVTAKSTVQ